MHRQCPHYNHGRINFAFVFSAPGAREVACKRPAAGVTGENLETALAYLAKVKPQVFGSADRYAYRITNAHKLPLARSRGDARTEATIPEVLKSENIARVLRDLEGCQLAVLCGHRAHLLAAQVRKAGIKVIEVSHTSNQALVAVHNTPTAKRGATPGDRRSVRALAWAEDLLSKLSDE